MKTEPMDIGDAVSALRGGLIVRRRGWNDKGMHLMFMDIPQTPFIEALPHVVLVIMEKDKALSGTMGTVVPWTCSQTDLLANDWEVVS